MVFKSAAAEAYSELNDDHADAAAISVPGPGPLLSNAEWTSGGEASHVGAIGCN
ncbi:MAG: hypothetical protein WBA69_09485 [Mycobacterium sp.]